VIRDAAWGEPLKRLTLMTYDRGPVGFLSSQIVKSMQRVCYPCAVIDDNSFYLGIMRFEHETYGLFEGETSPDGQTFWDILSDCVDVCAEKFSIEIIELGQGVYGLHWLEPCKGSGQLEQQFKVHLPKVWAHHLSAQKLKQTNANLRSRLVA